MHNERPSCIKAYELHSECAELWLKEVLHDKGMVLKASEAQLSAER
jgi:hypothetical protein